MRIDFFGVITDQDRTDIDNNSFVNQLYNKTKIICKKAATCKKKQGDINFALESMEGNYIADIG